MHHEPLQLCECQRVGDLGLRHPRTDDDLRLDERTPAERVEDTEHLGIRPRPDERVGPSAVAGGPGTARVVVLPAVGRARPRRRDVSDRGLRHDRADRVVRTHDDLGPPVGDQPVTPHRRRRRERPGDREDRPAELRGVVRGVQRPRPSARLDHDGGVAQRSDQPVPRRKLQPLCVTPAPRPVPLHVNDVRAATYLRQSIDHAEGIERQRARTTALAEQRGWPVVRVYEDNATSASKDRGAKSGWATMLADIRSGRVTHVVAVDLDRLVRSTRDLLVLIDAGAVVTTVDGELDLSSADGEFRATMLAGIARFEVRRKSERQVRANAHRAQQGKPNPGRRRYGYLVDGMTPHPDEAPVVRDIFQRTDEGQSLRSIMLWLRGEGIVPGTGNTWTTRRLRDMLASRHYEGYMLHRGEWHESVWITPLINAAQAERVRTMLADPTRRTSPGTAVRHQLSGIATCGVCGSSLLYMRAYRCKADAKHPSIIKTLLETPVREAVIAALLFGPARILPTDEQGQTLAALTEALDAVRRRKDDVLALIREGLSTLAAERPGLAVLTAEEEALTGRRDALTSTSVAAQVLAGAQSDLWSGSTVSIADAATIKSRLRERFDTLDLERQRELIHFLLDIEVFPGRSADRVHIAHRVVTTLNEEND